MTSTVTGGVAAVPPELLERLGLGEGARIEWSVVGGRLVGTPLREGGGAYESRMGSAKDNPGVPSVEDLVRIRDEERSRGG